MLKTLKNAWGIPDVRKRILYTLFMVIVIRVGAQIPVPGTNASVIKQVLDSMNESGAFNIFNSFTGSSLERFSILALSITPYITSSIVMELLTIAIPKLEELHKDGNEGRKKIAKYTRYLTVALALAESIAMSIGFGTQGLFGTRYNWFYVVVAVLALTAGSAFLMWVGEQITDKGIGNGISIVLVVNILSGIPEDLGVLFTTFTSGKSIPLAVVISVLTVAVILVIVAFVVWVNGAIRKIPVQYSGKIVGRRTLGGQQSNIPLKVMTASVIPVIFASSLMSIPAMVMQFFGTGSGDSVWNHIVYFLSSNYWFRAGIPWYYSLGVLIYLALIFVFAFFYTSITFNPTEVADNLKKQGGFIPGIRPGKPSADYLNSVLNRIVFIGAFALAIVALIPIIISGVFNISKVSFLGTSLIIIVGVILETLQQLEGRMVAREYDSIF
ncbi:MAG: preprotein translocase subunit SecY [Lachnospiraceae bacterium]|nr:preprotein translocase subunit SecY [Lachnospiraceae bacterium]